MISGDIETCLKSKFQNKSDAKNVDKEVENFITKVVIVFQM